MSKPTTSKHIEQTVAANSLRNAGNNYTENTTHIYGDLQAWKYQTPMSELNRLAVGNEFYFVERFGFDYPEEQRQHIIAIKEHFDYTDPTIKTLKRSGAFILKKGEPARVQSDWIGCSACVLLMILCALVIMLYSLVVFLRAHNPLLGAGCVAALTAVYVWYCWDLYRITLKPAAILRKSGIPFGGTFTLPTH